MAEYPGGKSMKLPAGRLSMFTPGDGEVVESYGEIERKENSAFHCGERMSALVPGCAIGKVHYKRD